MLGGGSLEVTPNNSSFLMETNPLRWIFYQNLQLCGFWSQRPMVDQWKASPTENLMEPVVLQFCASGGAAGQGQTNGGGAAGLGFG